MPEQWHQPRPWQTQSRACPRETQMQKETKTRQKITTTNRLPKHRKSLKTPSGICQAKSQGSSAASLADTEPQQVTFPPPPLPGAQGWGGGWGTHPCIAWRKRQWTALSSQQGLRFRPPREGDELCRSRAAAPGGLRGGSGAHLPVAWPPPPAREYILFVFFCGAHSQWVMSEVRNAGPPCVMRSDLHF